MLVFVLNQTQKANTGKIQTPVYENVREFGFLTFTDAKTVFVQLKQGLKRFFVFCSWLRYAKCFVADLPARVSDFRG